MTMGEGLAAAVLDFGGTMTGSKLSVTIDRKHNLRGLTGNVLSAVESKTTVAAGQTAIILQLVGGAIELRGRLPSGIQITHDGNDYTTVGDGQVLDSQSIALTITPVLVSEMTAADAVTIADSVAMTINGCVRQKVRTNAVPPQIAESVTEHITVPRLGAAFTPRVRDILTDNLGRKTEIHGISFTNDGAWGLLVGVA